jgi:hypothetical protein
MTQEEQKRMDEMVLILEKYPVDKDTPLMAFAAVESSESKPPKPTIREIYRTFRPVLIKAANFFLFGGKVKMYIKLVIAALDLTFPPLEEGGIDIADNTIV